LIAFEIAFDGKVEVFIKSAAKVDIRAPLGADTGDLADGRLLVLRKEGHDKAEGIGRDFERALGSDFELVVFDKRDKLFLDGGEGRSGGAEIEGGEEKGEDDGDGGDSQRAGKTLESVIKIGGSEVSCESGWGAEGSRWLKLMILYEVFGQSERGESLKS